MNLTHKRILITRPRAQADEFANALIAERRIRFFPGYRDRASKRFCCSRYSLLSLCQYDWLILTSIHGVNVFFNGLRYLALTKFHSTCVWLPLVQERSLSIRTWAGSRLCSKKYIAEAILPGLGRIFQEKDFCSTIGSGTRNSREGFAPQAVL